jgi:hypothetical protein
MALRKAEPPTSRCRSVLIALSGGDRRRQLALKAGDHLLECSYCAELSEPLIERRSSLAGIAPFAAFGKFLQVVRQAAHSGKVQATLGATTVAAVGIAAAMASHQPSPAPPHHKGPPRSLSRLTTEKGVNLMQMPRAGDLKRYAGSAVEARGITVASVPADEGFWIEAGAGDRLWVQMRHPDESKVHVQAGDRVSFHGRIVDNDPHFSRRVGLSAAEGASKLTRTGYHITVRHVRDQG